MMETQEHLLERNKIAASIGQDIVIEQLKKYRERFIGQLKSAVPTQSDPNGINLHRYLGRIEAIDFLISEGERATKPNNNTKE